jgi:hypothetical protein
MTAARLAAALALLGTAEARAAAGDEPHLALSMHAGMLPAGRAGLGSLNTQVIAHLNPWIAGSAEAGAYMMGSIPVIPHAQVGARAYLLPPRPWSVAPYLSLRGGAGFLFPFVSTGVIWMATATGGLEVVFGRPRQGFPPFFVNVEAGQIWMRTDLEPLERPMFFGRAGLGIRF